MRKPLILLMLVASNVYNKVVSADFHGAEDIDQRTREKTHPVTSYIIGKKPTISPKSPTCAVQDAKCVESVRKGWKTVIVKKNCCDGLRCVRETAKKQKQDWICDKVITMSPLEKPQPTLAPKTLSPTPNWTKPPYPKCIPEYFFCKKDGVKCCPALDCKMWPTKHFRPIYKCVKGDNQVSTTSSPTIGFEFSYNETETLNPISNQPNDEPTHEPTYKPTHKTTLQPTKTMCLAKNSKCADKRKGQCCDGLNCCNRWKKCGENVSKGFCVEKQPDKPTCLAKNSKCADKRKGQCCDGLNCCNRWKKCGENVSKGFCVMKK